MTKIRHTVKAAALALSLVVASGTAHATNYAFGTIAPGATMSQVSSPPKGNFSDSFTFSITQSGPDGEYSYFNFLVKQASTTLSNISNAKLTLTGPVSFGPTNLMDGEVGLALLAGSYTANVTGTADGQGGGAYSFAITAPTPEPAVWLTMLLGASMIGYAVRRRNATAVPGALLPA